MIVDHQYDIVLQLNLIQKENNKNEQTVLYDRVHRRLNDQIWSHRPPTVKHMCTKFTVFFLLSLSLLLLSLSRVVSKVIRLIFRRTIK